MKNLRKRIFFLLWGLVLCSLASTLHCSGEQGRCQNEACSKEPPTPGELILLNDAGNERNTEPPQPDKNQTNDNVPPDPTPPTEKKPFPDNTPLETPSDTGKPTRDTTATPENSPVESTSEERAPCEGKVCGTNAFCDEKIDGCRCLEGHQGSPITGCTPIPPPKGWIGTACTQKSDCAYSGGFCQLAAQGYPGGHCSQSCTRFCPDTAGRPITFCIAEPNKNTGNCFARCDTSLFPNNQGCRADYECRSWERFNESRVVKEVCVPKNWKPPTQPPCADPTNLKGDDNCYFRLVSYGDATLESLARKLLKGNASKQEALDFLDKNFTASRAFMKNDLNIKTVNNNYTKGHHSSRRMLGMIIHYTASQTEDGTIRYFVGSAPHASTHFILGSKRNGLIVQIYSHKDRTWHAGSTYNIDRFGLDFANAGYLKPSTTGGWVDYAKRKYTLNLPLHGNNPIKVVGGIPGASSKYSRLEDWQPYTYYQLLSFVLVGRALHKVYSLDTQKIQRHGDVASSRVDPGPALPTTSLKKLLFTNDDVFQLPWLNLYKTQKDWIAKNPTAR